MEFDTLNILQKKKKREEFLWVLFLSFFLSFFRSFDFLSFREKEREMLEDLEDLGGEEEEEDAAPTTGDRRVPG